MSSSNRADAPIALPPLYPVQDESLSEGSPGDEECGKSSASLDKVSIERLGRQRPAALVSLAAEVGFVASVVMAMMVAEYFISGFNIVLPPLADALDMPASSRTWAASVTSLSTAALLLPFARLCDMYGSRAVFLSGHLWLLVWALIAGFSKNTSMLIVCRAMQGAASAAFLPAGLAMLGRTYRPGPRMNFVFVVYGAFASIGFYAGIVIGAVAAEHWNWRWYFWAGAGIELVVFTLGFLSIPRNLRDCDADAKMDWAGLFTIVPGLALVILALTSFGHVHDGWRMSYTYAALAVGILLLLCAIYAQGWVSLQPLLPPEIFRTKYMKRLTMALFCSYGVFGIYLFYTSMYIEEVMHVKPVLAAAWFTPLAAGGLVLAVGGGFILHKVSSRVLMAISSLAFVCSVLLLALAPGGVEATASKSFVYWAYVFPAMLAATIAVDISFNVSNIFISTAMPHRHQATASGVINSLLYLGIAFWLGVADLAVSVTARRQKADTLDSRSQCHIGYWIGVCLASVSLFFVLSVKMGKAESALTVEEKAALPE